MNTMFGIALVLSHVMAQIETPATSSTEVQRLAFGLLRSCQYCENSEVGAFLVRGDDGGLALVPWPNTKPTYHCVRWDGPPPQHIIGVIHTHPRSLPRPSRQDILEARRLDLPFYVVSLWDLCLAEPAGRVTCDPWRPDIRATSGSPAASPDPPHSGH